MRCQQLSMNSYLAISLHAHIHTHLLQLVSCCLADVFTEQIKRCLHGHHAIGVTASPPIGLCAVSCLFTCSFAIIFSSVVVVDDVDVAVVVKHKKRLQKNDSRGR